MTPIGATALLVTLSAQVFCSAVAGRGGRNSHGCRECHEAVDVELIIMLVSVRSIDSDTA